MVYAAKRERFLQVSLFERQPTADFRAQIRIIRQVAAALCQIEQDGGGFDEGPAVVELQNGDSSETAELLECWACCFPLGQIQGDSFVREPKLIEQDAYFPRVAREPTVIEPQHVHTREKCLQIIISSF
ncbi:hypothetical protein D9M73_198570 [compost metagenome]